MITANKIIEAIEKLPENEFRKIRKWIADREWEQWDDEILSDSNSGNLDFLLQEGMNDNEITKKL